jgi:GntR family transcriptional regulator/MocR family aminotransferase
MTTLPSGLPVAVERADPVPLAVQISAQLEAAVTGGVLRAGDRLPSSRDLAVSLGVSRTVVTNAYARLFAEGWLEGRHGSGTYVADVAARPAVLRVSRPRAAPRPGAKGPAAGPGTPAGADEPGGRPAPIDLQPGISWAEGIEPAAWRRAWRRAGARLPSRWPDPYGLPELREAIAAYLRRSRGLVVGPERVLITQGVSSGLALLADVLLTPGDQAGIEEPGYPTGREVLRRAGARVVPCRVDAHGIVPEELPDDLKLLYTTPAHQYPLGGRLPVSRRQALIAWARASGAIIVEDDYDSEFRYDVGPLPALYSMDPDVIVYLGTASKILATAFGAGWLVAPPELVDKLAALRPQLGVRIPEPVQHAILALLGSGDLERHIRKMRLEYARRRAVLVDGLTRAGRDGADASAGANGPPFRLLGDTAGMHVVLELPGDFPVGRVIDAAAERGVAVYPLDRYFAGRPTMNGLIIGYGTATLPQIRRAAAELAMLLRRFRDESVTCPPAHLAPRTAGAEGSHAAAASALRRYRRLSAGLASAYRLLRRRRSIRASAKPTVRAAASTVAPCPIRCSARSRRRTCWYRRGVMPVAATKRRVRVRSLTPQSAARSASGRVSANRDSMLSWARCAKSLRWLRCRSMALACRSSPLRRA